MKAAGGKGKTFADQLTKGRDTVDLNEFAGGLPQVRATLPHIRVGKRWFSGGRILMFGVPLGLAALVGAVFLCQHLRTISSIEAWIVAHPGTGSFSEPVHSGFPWWLRYQHYLNLFVMLFMMRSGLQILADHPRLYTNPHCTPGTDWLRISHEVPENRLWTAKDDAVALPWWLGLPGLRHTIGLARWWHASLDTIWLLNGIAFYVLIFSTDQWQRFIPQSWDVFPEALSTMVQYLSLDFPPASGWLQYNGVQMIAYFTTVFIAAPLAIVTGILQSPAVSARISSAQGPLNRQVARTIHFAVLLYFVSFIAIHVTMVAATGFVRNLNHITRGVQSDDYGGVIIFAIGITPIIVAWLLASWFTLKYPRVIQHIGRFVTGWIRSGLERLKPVAEFEESQISPFFWPNGSGPGDDDSVYRKHFNEGFKNHRFKIGGLVENEVEMTLDELKALPKSSQVTAHYCIQGWSGIAKWGGVQMSEIMKIVQPKPEAKFVAFYSFAHGAGDHPGLYYDCHKIAHMHHKHAILAYEMNDDPLPELHGAPLRLRNEVELGFKQIKWIQAIEFIADIRDLGSGQGGFNEDNEYFGYRGPI